MMTKIAKKWTFSMIETFKTGFSGRTYVFELNVLQICGHIVGKRQDTMQRELLDFVSVIVAFKPNQ